MKWFVSFCQGMVWQVDKIYNKLFKQNPYSGKVTACLDQLATCGKFNLVAMTHFAAMNMHS